MMKRSIVLLLLLVCAWTAVADASFYKEPALFSTRPSETKSLQSVDRFGPVGIGIELLQPAFVMRVKNVEPGSPAAETGQIKKGQIIETINGAALKDIDPRIQLGQILAQAEATDGRVVFKLKDVAEPVVVQVPVLGAYSATWPLNCGKSDKIVRQVAEYLKSPKANEGLGGIGMLFLVSTGDQDDLAFVQAWARKAPAHSYPWYVGYGGIGLAECYLKTGDPLILENIQRWVDSAVRTQHNDAWAGRGTALTTYGNGHLNASGTHVLTFLLLAKECGADVPDFALLRALRHFYRYAGRGGNPYGDDRPGGGFVDNGKNGKLAFAMAAAAALTPDGEDSVYAKARDHSAMYSFYSTSFMLHGHTGGGIGEIWRSAAMGLLHDIKPKQYRDFMDSRAWHYDLSRRYDGSFGILGGSGYDKEQWGVAYPLTYTMPRKTLRITGAPPTEHSKLFALPERPWGTAADEVFLSLESVPGKDGQTLDLSSETLANDSSMQFIRWFHGEAQPTDEDIRRYIRHPERNIRVIAAFKALGIDSGYIGWRKPGGKVRPALVQEFLNHDDPRVRRAILGALHTAITREGKRDLFTNDLFDRSVAAIQDPDESWYIKDVSLQLIGLGSADQIVPHVDLLLDYLQHEESWLKNAALTALTPVATDERVYEKVIPAIGNLIKHNQRVSVTRGLAPAIRAKVQAAPPKVQALAKQTLQESYTGYAGQKVSKGGQDLTPTYDFHLEAIAESLANVPGGLDALYRLAREQYPDEILPYKEFFLNADPSQFGPELKQAMTPIILNELVPEFVGKNRKNLRALAANEVQSGFPGGPRDAIDGLAGLYARAGKPDYGWTVFADLRNAEWSYHSFDPVPAEQVPWDQLISRYREVTVPQGMANWYAKDFEPSAAGWKSGKSPFGVYDGKLPTRPFTKCSANCTGPHCYGATPINTLWEKEVLLMRGTFKVPPIEDGYRYRLRINDGNHVGAGGGCIVYINGKELIEIKQGGGRGSGNLQRGAYITQDFLDDLKAGEVTIAIKTFIRYNEKYKVKPTSPTSQGKMSIHLESQKLPAMGDDLVFQSAAIVPMTSSDWQAKFDKDNPAQDPEENKFRWDGTFEDNPAVRGQWQAITELMQIEDFDPERRYNANRVAYKTLRLDDAGKTNEPTLAWSGDTLMDLNQYQALKLVPKQIDGVDYLFVEAGGFSPRHRPDWQSRWWVYKRPR